MALQNRVTPFGEIVADPARGLFMGNRGGRIHDPETRRLTARRWASRRWICCVCSFKGRRRQVMGAGYTELFFLDEVTALAAGHRPCFECRRADAEAFARCWSKAQGSKTAPKADAMDLVLHEERLRGMAGHRPRLSAAALADLPDGAMVAAAPTASPAQSIAYALRGASALAWRPGGYGEAVPRKTLSDAVLLTPPAICAVLAAGYRPRWHGSVSSSEIDRSDKN